MSHDPKVRILLAGIFLLPGFLFSVQPRSIIPLMDDWTTQLVTDEMSTGFAPIQADFDDAGWQAVTLPHSWDSYEGYSQAKHGNLHGTAWYRTRFNIDPLQAERRVFLYFEGVGSFARVFVNGSLAGEHAGGLTTFTLDITEMVIAGQPNILSVEARHPAGTRTLPWVCGGCELAMGFSEGPQPFGIFRPVSIVITNPLRIEPFGIHAWNDASITEEAATLHLRSEIKNYGNHTRDFELRTRLVMPDGASVFEISKPARLAPGRVVTLEQTSPVIDNPTLWSPDSPFLYRIVSEVLENGKVIDRVETPYGIRWIEWPDIDGPPDQSFRINGKPFFINGVADYEHLLGRNHAFTDEQIAARVGQLKSAGFNAFRDAHHPHNLQFNQHWDRNGILWWTQFGAHIWFDTDAFRTNYKRLLRDWIRERRNSPSLVLYGLQNESKLPYGFASECADIIRELDPTATSQRLVTTCNGGVGTDWDVPQNWSGTYGGNLLAYSEDLRMQRLVGEYGAWRSLGLHSEGDFIEKGILSEDRMTALMETKVRLAESVRDKVAGHFAWPLYTHQNPGRNVGSRGQQARDGIRMLDRIGPANNKGLFTTWGEPLDVFYMYRSNYAPADSEPMAYIVSHTWPDRWTVPGIKGGIIVYSNCEEVELFNGYKSNSLGVRTRGARGTHFQWDNVDISTNVLYAVGRINGKTVATDIIQLHHLPDDPCMENFDTNPEALTRPVDKFHYLYRINAGGPDYKDQNGHLWQADRFYQPGDAWGSTSWASRFPNLVPMFGSRRIIHDPVLNTADDPLFQSFRYGREELNYVFKVPDGDYRIDLYFIEPWYGTGGGMNCAGWRLFDVAVNGETVIRDLDIWKETGRASAIRKSVDASSLNGKIVLSFPRVQAGQAVISAISIASRQEPAFMPPADNRLISLLEVHPDLSAEEFIHKTWLDTGYNRLSDLDDSLSFVSWELRDAEWIQTPDTARQLDHDCLLSFPLTDDADVFVVHDKNIRRKPKWLNDWTHTSLRVETCKRGADSFEVFTRRFKKGDVVNFGPNGTSKEPYQMYSVIVRRRYPPPPARIVDEFSISGSKNKAGWQALGNFRSGQEIHSDGGAVIARFSSRLSDCDWIRAPQADAANPTVQCRLSTVEHTEVFVALDPSIEQVPGWLKGWVPSDYTVSTAEPDSVQYRMLKKRFTPGESIVLGPNGCGSNGEVLPMYTVILRTVRAAVRYEAEDLEKYQHLRDNQIEEYSGSGYVDLRQLGEKPFEWTMEVGVGDRYGLNFKYISSVPDVIPSTVLLIAPDGQVMCEEILEIPPTPDNQWQTTGFRTCDSINAGTYTVRFMGQDLKFLKFDSLVVE